MDMRVAKEVYRIRRKLHRLYQVKGGEATMSKAFRDTGEEFCQKVMNGEVSMILGRTVGYMLNGIGYNKFADAKLMDRGVDDDFNERMSRIVNREL